MKICKVEGCGEVHQAKGYCRAHYDRVYRTGSPGSPVVEKRSDKGCVVKDCFRPHKAKGYCSAHYYRVKRHGDPGLASLKQTKHPTGRCGVEGCQRPHEAKGYCSAHYKRVRLYGDPGLTKIKKPHPTGVCETNDCEEPIAALGLCGPHYRHLNKFGITPQEYDALLESQRGVCAICQRPQESRLRVDHDHETEEIRGLLCHKCNTGIGLLGDTLEGLQMAIQYLEG